MNVITENNVNHQEAILVNGEYFTSLLADIQQAKHSIDFEVYIFSHDTAGNMLADALCSASQRGVKIRVLVDGIGTPDWGNEMTLKMEQSGVETRVYHPLPWVLHHWQRHPFKAGSFFWKLYHLVENINLRNHRKTCVIDNSIAYVGSANITDHLLSNHDIWRETSVRMTNANYQILQYAFDKAWGDKKAKKIDGISMFRMNYNWKLRRIYYKSLLAGIAACTSRVWVTNAYFSPDDHILNRLIKAKKSGVDVKILLPHLSDVMISSLAAKTFYRVLLKHEIEIYEYLPTVLHAKSLILDDWNIVGSSNLNYRSLRHDLEVDVVLQSRHAQEYLENLFLTDITQAKKISLNDMENQPFFQYLLGRIVLIFRYFI